MASGVTMLQDATRRQMLSAVKTLGAELAKAGADAIGSSTIRAMESRVRKITGRPWTKIVHRPLEPASARYRF